MVCIQHWLRREETEHSLLLWSYIYGIEKKIKKIILPNPAHKCQKYVNPINPCFGDVENQFGQVYI